MKPSVVAAQAVHPSPMIWGGFIKSKPPKSVTYITVTLASRERYPFSPPFDSSHPSPLVLAAASVWASDYFQDDIPPACLSAASACNELGATGVAKVAAASTVAVAMAKRINASGGNGSVPPAEQHAVGMAAGLVTWVSGGAPADVSVAAAEAAVACGAEADWSRLIATHATLACGAATGPPCDAASTPQCSTINNDEGEGAIVGRQEAQSRFLRWQGSDAMRRYQAPETVQPLSHCCRMPQHRMT